MSASQAVFAGWMEIPNSAVDQEARTQMERVRAEEATLAALVSQYAGTLYRVAFSVLRNPPMPKTPCRRRFCACCATATRWAKCATSACG